jgi:hypothetical protein
VSPGSALQGTLRSRAGRRVPPASASDWPSLRARASRAEYPGPKRPARTRWPPRVGCSAGWARRSPWHGEACPCDGRLRSFLAECGVQATGEDSRSAAWPIPARGRAVARPQGSRSRSGGERLPCPGTAIPARRRAVARPRDRDPGAGASGCPAQGSRSRRGGDRMLGPGIAIPAKGRPDARRRDRDPCRGASNRPAAVTMIARPTPRQGTDPP